MSLNIFKISSIKLKVTALTLAIFIIGVPIFSYYISQKLQSDLTKQISEQQLFTTALLADQINNDLLEKRSALESLAEKIGLIGLNNTEQLQAFLNDRFIIKKNYNLGAFIINADGIVIASVPDTIPRIGTNLRSRSHIAHALEQGKPIISEIFADKASQNYYFSIVVPIHNTLGSVIGALSGDIDLTKPNFLDKITHGHYGKTGYYLLKDQKTRIIITSTDERQVLQQEPPPGKNWLIDRHLLGFEESDIATNPFGIEVLASAKRISVANWVMVTVLPTAEAFIPIKEMQSRIIISATLMTLILGTIIWWLLLREISPVFSIINKLSVLAKSETHDKLLPETQKGEIGDLIRAFNHLLKTLHEREKALEESKFRWKFAIEGTGDGLWDWDIPTNRVFFSKTWKTMLGYSESEIDSNLNEWMKLVHPEDLPSTMIAVKEHLDGKTPIYSNEHRLLCKDGSYKWILDRGLIVSRDEYGAPLRAIGTHTDISERKKMEELIRQQALYDALTKLPNRRLLIDRLTQAMSISKRTNNCGALLFLDLDNFKPLNDTHGHEAGDLLLMEVAKRLKRCVRKSDTIARMGGDEFVAVLSQLGKDKETSKYKAGMLAEKIRIELAKSYALKIQDKNGKNVMIKHLCTASIGATLFFDDEINTDDILRNADDAMYQAKNSGRNRVCFYDEGKKA